VLFLNVGNATPEVNQPNVMYRGHVADTAELALYYSAADTLLFTSIAENFPLVVLEAMSCGLPIVSFDVGGVKEVVIHRENGYIVPYCDTEALAEGLSWVLKLSATEHATLGLQSSKKIAQSYDTAHMVQSYLDLYTNVITTYE